MWLAGLQLTKLSIVLNRRIALFYRYCRLVLMYMYPSVVKAFISSGGIRSNQLKQDSVESNKAWKAAGKPRPGPVFFFSDNLAVLFIANA